MPEQDIRWRQRFNHYRTALEQLGAAADLAAKRPLSDLEKQGLIQAFEFTHELAWNTLRDYFFYQGNPDIHGSRDASREAFRQGLIEDGDVWMNMIKSRNMSSHTYNRKTTEAIIDAVLREYYPGFRKLEKKLDTLLSRDQQGMPYGLSEEVLGRITGVFAGHPEIEEAILYGSRAQGDYRTGSDIDLTFTGDTLTLAALNRIDNELDELLLPYSFDLSLLAQIDSTRLLEHIDRVGKTIYRRTPTPG